MLRPTIAALFPSIEMSYAFNTSITASAVHGANPVESPENTFAIFTGEMPSRSFFGSIMASMSFHRSALEEDEGEGYRLHPDLR